MFLFLINKVAIFFLSFFLVFLVISSDKFYALFLVSFWSLFFTVVSIEMRSGRIFCLRLELAYNRPLNFRHIR